MHVRIAAGVRASQLDKASGRSMYGSTLCVVWPSWSRFPARALGAGGGRPSIDLVAAVIRREKKKNVVQMGGMPERRDGDRLRSCSALAQRSVPVLSCAAAAAAGSEWYVIDQEGRKLVRICFFFL